MDIRVAWALFCAGSLLLLALSWRSMRRPGSHGFPRFLAWVGILALLVLNGDVWFEERYSARQLVSWCLLMTSIAVVVTGLFQLKSRGRPVAGSRNDGSLYDFEQTTRLVDSGIYAWIRHPMYLSLMLLAWGAAVKDLTGMTLALAVFVSLCLYITARQDENECLVYFGTDYGDYMQRSKRFLPFLW